MKKLIEFIAVENVKPISDNYDYVDSIYKCLQGKGYINTIAVAPGTKSLCPIVECDEESSCFILDYNSCVASKSNIWRIQFQFGTYDSRLQLAVSIFSDTYLICVEDDYLEKVKLSIKDFIVSDWKDIVWLIDNDSQCISESLYPNLYKTENLLRRLINSVMNKVYGTDWWEMFVPYDIRMKHRGRLKGYKSAVPGFRNVDERLMSIDIGDLFTIVTFDRKKWVPKYDEEISLQLNGMSLLKDKRIIELLTKQLESDISLWNKWFSKYLSSSFINDFSDFEKYRNHVAHNKLLDRSAYRKIEETTKKVEKEVDDAIQKADADILSVEEKINIKSEKEELRVLLEECEHDTKENEANVKIRRFDEIESVLFEAVDDVVSNIYDELCFREDIKIEREFASEDGQIVLSIESKITEEVIKLSISCEICDEEGADSYVSLKYGENKSEKIHYTNGAVEFDFDQCIYMPITEDGLSSDDIEDAEKGIFEYIQDHVFIKEQVHSAIERRTKDDCFELPIAEMVQCAECGECEICVDDSYAMVGTCLNCGYKNDIEQCDRCEEWFNPEIDGQILEDCFFCQNCLDEMNEE